MRNLQLQVILAAVDRATGPLKQIAGGSAGAALALRQTRDNLKGLQDQQKRITAFTDMTAQAKATKSALTDKSRELQKLNTEIGASENPGKRLVRQQITAQKEVDKLTKRYDEQLKKSRDLTRELPAKAAGIRNLGHQQSELAKQVDAANKKLELQQSALKRMGEADLAGNYRNMRSEVSSFATATIAAGTAAAGGIFALANSTATLGDEIGHAADRIGINRTALQEIRYAGEIGGGMDIAAVDASLLTFTRRLGLAARGTGAAVKAYDELGLSADALSRMQPEQALALVADRLAEIGDHNDQLSYASQIFDTGGGANMLKALKDGSAGLESYARDARMIGYILGEKAVADSEAFKHSLDMSTFSLRGMKNIIGAELMPVVTQLMDTFSGWLVENRPQVEAFGRAFGQRLQEAVPTIISLGKGLAKLVSTIASIIRTVAWLVGGFENLAVVLAVLFSLKMIVAIGAFIIALYKTGSAILLLAKTLPIAATGMKFFAGAVAMVGTALKTMTAFLLANPIVLAIAAIAGLAYLIYKNWGAVKNWFTTLWTEVTGAFQGGLAGITRLLLNWSPIGMIWRAITGGLRMLGMDIPAQFSSFGGAIVDGLIGGITAKLSALRSAITGAGGRMASWFKDALGINSPSRVFAQFGINTMDGFQQGLQRKESEPIGVLTGFVKRLKQIGAGVAIGAASSLAAAMPASVGIDTGAINRIPLDARGPLQAGSQAGGLTIEGGIHITVQSQPGMNEQQLAQYIGAEVQRALANAHHQASARQRSALYDTD